MFVCDIEISGTYDLLMSHCCSSDFKPFHYLMLCEMHVSAGGVTSMSMHGVDSNYCKYDNQSLQLFTSSLYLAALVATMFASSVTRNLSVCVLGGQSWSEDIVVGSVCPNVCVSGGDWHSARDEGPRSLG